MVSSPSRGSQLWDSGSGVKRVSSGYDSDRLVVVENVSRKETYLGCIGVGRSPCSASFGRNGCSILGK